jgi:hypothetical protein
MCRRNIPKTSFGVSEAFAAVLGPAGLGFRFEVTGLSCAI